MAWDPLIESFLENRRRHRDVTAGTCDTYGGHLTRWFAHCRKWRIDPMRARTHELVGYLEGLNVKPASIANVVVTLRSFYRWANVHAGAPDNPARPIKIPRVRAQLIPPPSSSQVAELYAAIDTGRLTGRRLKTLISLWYGCGLRISESVALQPADIDPGRREVRVYGKGSEWRVVPIPTRTLEQVAWWERHGNPTAGHLFPGRSRLGHITPEVPRRDLRELARRFDPARANHWHPHIFRHACAVHMIQNGSDVRSVQMMLGHSDIRITERYLSLTSGEVQSVVDRTHPFAA